MKTPPAGIPGVFAFFLAFYAFAQTPSVVSPEIGTDRKVTLRFFDPQANQVSLEGQWPGGTAQMARHESGLWTVTVGPVKEDSVVYDFRVNGQRQLDPINPLMKSVHGSLFSVIEMANRPGPPASVLSPEIGLDDTVTFRLRVPNAGNVSVEGQWPNGHAAMSKGPGGIWCVTTGPIPPGIWEYSFNVDGLEMIDPDNSMNKPMRLPTVSILDIKSHPAQPWDLQNVPHGTVHWHTYFSSSLGRFRELAVYTPPGYENEKRKKFPVLYLQHGYGDNQETWVVHGKANMILDNLIASNRTRAMIIVMADGHAKLPVTAPDANFLSHNTDLFERDLLHDIMPLIARNYRVKRGPANTAIAGLSMGGGESLTIGINHPDIFGWVAGFSAATPTTGALSGALQNPGKLNEKLRLLYIADGRDDFLLQRNEGFLSLLSSYNIKYEWHLTEGDHSWPVWRNYLADLVPRLFR
ncbi:MAG TPA: alpha/beta hydrolase-fold protein [Candidatus Sulfotelmatobacter sp.]|nr:alpha/beta hydrolase-fold protein [Candidatus Sulfotelmatobacter sp.]